MGDNNRGGFEQGFGRRDRGRGKRQRRARTVGEELASWCPVTKLGRLVKKGLIPRLEDIYLHSLPIKESQIIDHFYQDESRTLKDDVMKVMPVQKQTRAGQRTRFKAFVAVGDHNGHIGLGVKVAKEVATAIRGAIIAAKLSLIPVRRGYWGNKIGQPHTVPMKVSGKCGSVLVKLIPAPRGALVVGAPTTKKLLAFAGVHDCFTASKGSTKTRGNFMKAVFDALKQTYGFLTPDLWTPSAVSQSPFQQFTDELAGPVLKPVTVEE